MEMTSGVRRIKTQRMVTHKMMKRVRKATAPPRGRMTMMMVVSG